MGNRFTVKDFIFLVIMLALLGLIGLTLGQYNYQGRQILSLRKAIANLNTQQSLEIQILQKIAAHGLTVGNAPAAKAVNVRKTLPNGDRYVCFPNPPLSPHNPYSKPDYSPGDWLVLNLNSQPKKIAPFITNDESSAEVQAWVLESLLVQNPVTLRWDPWLARSYTATPNDMQVTFHLRKRACFSDGKPVLASDVIFSFNTIMNPLINAAPYRAGLTDVKSCVATGRRTVVFTMKKPYFQALEQLGSINIIEKGEYNFTKPRDYNRQGAKLEGSGPYMLDTWKRGQYLVLVRNPRYWGPRPTFNRIKYLFINNPQAALQQYLKGQLDVTGLEPSEWLKYIHQPGFTKSHTCYSYLSPLSGYLFIGWNLKKPMFHDRLTRTALTMLVDRKAIIKTFMKGLALPITGPFNPGSPQNNSTLKPIPYDPAQARVLLAKAGWKMGPNGVLVRNGQPFVFNLTMPAGDPLSNRIATYIKQQLARGGIDMTIAPLEFSVLVHRINLRQFSAIFLGWTGEIEDDPYQIWDSACINNEGDNAVGFADAEADKLISEGRAELNTAKRMAIWHKLQAVIYRQQPYMFLFTSKSLVFINHRFKNTKPYKLLGLSQGDWYVPLANQKYH